MKQNHTPQTTAEKTGPQTEAEHAGHMKAVQADMRAKLEATREKRGLVIVHTGNGKGKSTAGFGMVARMLAHKRKCAVIQFIKSSNDAVAKLLDGPNLRWHHVGEGFTWDTQNRDADIAQCRAGWQLALEHMRDPEISLIDLDEINVVLDLGYLPVDEVLAALRQKRPDQHIVCTGRNAPAALIELADLVTEMREIKHPFNTGVQAQAGIEF
ncbi:cob(I)alamin adenosyltransferase [Ereboglobus sp. PH5-5]|uniref:cob(I)yrinic acid a,c-diamide adenosyltransferase n=1 Tax=unclassified Ereboglobus TaxID=2626932 RepID=UPI00240533AB|nr:MULTISPECIES: cob(I)yrinic acid a,c-diamide adenosyltransferase [unclassified Ereboglobus]MDF9826916.1 cob(I)alamin adenosyltransferase [Ereboglobus sp. PH5-10]MDF9831940.1 cob(I)alamin adenosyltransferase [Ereboglobus sp. PH5-5]